MERLLHFLVHKVRAAQVNLMGALNKSFEETESWSMDKEVKTLNYPTLQVNSENNINCMVFCKQH